MTLAVLKMPIRNRIRYRKRHGNGNRMIRGSNEIYRNIGPMEAAVLNNRTTYNENFHNIKNLVQHIMDFSHHIMHTIQHIIKCEQDIMTMMHQMFLFLTIRQLWRSILRCANFTRGKQTAHANANTHRSIFIYG